MAQLPSLFFRETKFENNKLWLGMRMYPQSDKGLTGIVVNGTCHWKNNFKI